MTFVSLLLPAFYFEDNDVVNNFLIKYIIRYTNLYY